MRNHRRALWLLPPTLLFAAAGCQVFQSSQPVSIVARDAETGKPVPGAAIRITYPVMPAYRAPASSSGTTGEDGVVQLRAAQQKDGFLLEANAPGYMLEEKSLAAPPAEPARLFGPAVPPAQFVVDMYAEPGPMVELVLPVGYRGLVKAEVHIQDDLPCPPGQRLFRYETPASGVVQVTGPALFRRVPKFRACYADGAPLSGDAKDMDIGFRWVKSEQGCEYYMVGTRFECDALRHSSHGEHSSSDPGKGTARGGRRKGRGGQPPADSSADGTGQ